jgi:U2 small nuclear ribonucleoprotein A'
VRFLDYRKVKDVEREKAKELFGTAAEPSALASKVSFPLLKAQRT